MPSGLLAQQPQAAHMAAGRHHTISLKICSVDCVPSLCVSFFTCEMQMHHHLLGHAGKGRCGLCAGHMARPCTPLSMRPWAMVFYPTWPVSLSVKWDRNRTYHLAPVMG